MWFKKQKHKIQTQEDIKKSKNFCMVPWVHMYVLPDSKTLPCCVTDHEDKYSSVKDRSLKEAWNDEKFRMMRKLMLEDRPVYSCDYCITLEKSGVNSMRQRMNESFAHHADELAKTNKDGSLDDPKMRYLDIRFSNICNFKCRGCSPTLSTQWYDDHQKLWDFESTDKKLINDMAENPKVWNELMDQFKNLEKAYFAGGEPLLMEEHYKCLEILIENNRTDVELSYNSNLSVLRFKNYDLVELWKQFSKVSLMVSLDDIETRGEYFRKGLVWEKFVKNMNEVKEKLPHIEIKVNCTVSLFNIMRIPEIHSFLFENKFIDSKGFIFNALVTPELYRCQVLPKKIKMLVQTKLNDYASSLKTNYPDEDWGLFLYDLEKQIQYMLEEDKSNLLGEFKERTEKLDAIREENFKETYPELKSII